MPHSISTPPYPRASALAVKLPRTSLSPHSQSWFPAGGHSASIDPALSHSHHSGAEHETNSMTIAGLVHLMGAMEARLNEKIDSIDRDLDEIKHGGWTVAVGPFRQQTKPSSDNAHDGTSKNPTLHNYWPMKSPNGGAAHPKIPNYAVQGYHVVGDMAPEPLSEAASGHGQSFYSLSAERHSDEKRNDQHHSGTQTRADAHDRVGSHERIHFPAEVGKTSTPEPTSAALENGGESRHPAAKASPDSFQEKTAASSADPPSTKAMSPSRGESDRDTPIPSVEDRALAACATYQPLAICRLPRLELGGLLPTSDKVQTFSAAFLHKVLGGKAWSPGLYLVDATDAVATSLGEEGGVGRLLPSKTYYVMSRTNEPFLPKEPGHHGTKLTAFFHNVEMDYEEGKSAYLDVPLFITAGTNSEYTYYGNYSQLRWSDKLDHERLVEMVPDHVKMHIAETLTEPGRPEWVTRQLMEHFWPKPDYIGDLPKKNGRATTVTPKEDDAKHEEQKVDGNGADDGMSEEVMLDMKDHLEELVEWERDASIKAGLLKKENILQAFEREDATDPPGLRLWWEYLQCVGWDADFYQLLVRLKDASK